MKSADKNHGNMFDSLKKAAPLAVQEAKAEEKAVRKPANNTPSPKTADKNTERKKEALPPKAEKRIPSESASEPLVAMSMRISRRYDIFIKIMSSRRRMIINEYLKGLLTEEKNRVQNGNGPDAYEIHMQIPQRVDVVQRHVQLPQSLIEFIDEESHYLGIKKSQYINYILDQECKEKIKSGEYEQH